MILLICLVLCYLRQKGPPGKIPGDKIGQTNKNHIANSRHTSKNSEIIHVWRMYSRQFIQAATPYMNYLYVISLLKNILT